MNEQKMLDYACIAQAISCLRYPYDFQPPSHKDKAYPQTSQASNHHKEWEGDCLFYVKTAIFGSFISDACSNFAALEMRVRV